MSVLQGLKSGLLESSALRSVWGYYRRWRLHQRYIARRERYASVARERNLVYRRDDSIASIRNRLRSRGYSPSIRQTGEVHTFTFIPHIGWHRTLLNDLRLLGPVTEFDYVAHGYQPQEFLRLDQHAAKRRREMNALVLPALRAAHAMRPVDWVFVYASGLEVRAELISAIIDEFGVPVVNMCLDDKQSWTGPVLDGQHLGQVDVAAAFDLSWTSARVACEWYLVEGARPIYMPEGFDATTYRPLPVEQDIQTSFIGGAYGSRPSIVHYLKKHSIPVQTFGQGWQNSNWVQDPVQIICSSVINLGIGGIGYSEILTNVKARDFEIPGTGGGVYITSFNSDLAQHFIIGQEILCYRNRDELVELIRYYLAHQEEARHIAMKGRERCLAEHRWLHRYQRVCQILGIVDDSELLMGRTGVNGS